MAVDPLSPRIDAFDLFSSPRILQPSPERQKKWIVAGNDFVCPALVRICVLVFDLGIFRFRRTKLMKVLNLHEHGVMPKIGAVEQIQTHRDAVENRGGGIAHTLCQRVTRYVFS